MRALQAFGRFWWDFVIGEDWRIAAGVTAILALGAVLVAADVSDTVVTLTIGALLLAFVSATIVATGLRARRARR
ncbi:MAG: hypothetical protein U0R50_01590 [Gaiellales bacterium]